jgi:tyrosine-protein phosphatase SIW14
VKLRSHLRLFVVLVVAALLCVLVLRIYSAHEDAVTASYAPTIPALAEKLALPGVPNAGKVSDSLYRGAQPRDAGYQQLQRLGVSIVIDLRSTASEQAAEQRAVESLGMQHVGIPSSGFFSPSDEQVATFLKLLRDNQGKKTFVHCYFGDDRTGVMVAAYRIAEQHWTADQAYNEMRVFHFHGYLILMGRYVKSFPANFVVSPVFAPLRTPAARE